MFYPGVNSSVRFYFYNHLNTIMKFILRTILILLVLLIPTKIAWVYSSSSFNYIKDNNLELKQKRLDNYFTNLNRFGRFNGNVLIMQNGRVVLRKSYGFKNLRTKDSLNLNTAFQLASMSKQFTACAIMLLEQQGRLSYDDYVKTYIKKFPYEDITIRDLLTHRSGLFNYVYFAERKVSGRASKKLDNNDILNLINRYNPPRYYRRDRKFDYSNTGYMILASIVESISKEPFYRYLKSNVFDTLRMKDTFVYNKKTNLGDKNVAVGHVRRRRIVGDYFLNSVSGDKGIYSTVDDMLLWDKSLRKNTLLADSTLQKAFSPMGKDSSHVENYGFGWRLTEYNTKKLVYHGGWWKGFKGVYVHKPDDGTTIIVLGNNASYFGVRKFKILDLLYYNHGTDIDPMMDISYHNHIIYNETELTYEDFQEV